MADETLYQGQGLEHVLIFDSQELYPTIDVYPVGIRALYTPPPRPFRPADSWGIGPGVAREIPGTGGLVERVRSDDHEPLGPHLNYEIIIPGVKRNIILDNTHIPGIPKSKR